MLFEDTDCLTTLFYLHFLGGSEQEGNLALAEAVARLNRFDLILFLEPDVDFIQDGDRSEVIAQDRAAYSAKLKALYEAHGCRVISISGDYENRYREAIRLVDAMLMEEKPWNA